MFRKREYVGIDSSDSLMHYGVKGMKWRRNRPNSRTKHVTGTGKPIARRGNGTGGGSVGRGGR